MASLLKICIIIMTSCRSSILEQIDYKVNDGANSCEFSTKCVLANLQSGKIFIVSLPDVITVITCSSDSTLIDSPHKNAMFQMFSDVKS